jgi:uncharacterized protein YbbC (DUF1343 family)
LNGPLVAREMNSLNLPGVRCMAEQFTPTSSKFQNTKCNSIRFLITDRSKLDPVKLGLALATVLRKVHPNDWEFKQLIKLVGSAKVVEAIEKQQPLEQVLALSRDGLPEFIERRAKFLLY